MRVKGRVSPAKAAKLMSAHRNTVYAHCRKALEGEPDAKLHDVRREANGYVTISLDEVAAIKADGGWKRGGSIL